MDYSFEKLSASLIADGYVSLNVGISKSVAKTMHELAFYLGGSILPGRGGKLLETLNIVNAGDAPIRSLSRSFGSGIQPWHVDGSHRIVPPRYIILGCDFYTGTGAPPTQLMSIQDAILALSKSHSETFAITNGRSSFYSTIASRDRPWLRFDPGCMSARTSHGATMLAALDSLPVRPCLSMEWKTGDILAFDNWMVLHRRGHASGSGHRTLLRISLKD